jgi:hypothetical protein
MPGPAPSPNARRRNNAGDWRTLPAACERPTPKWPLPGRKPAGAVELWRHLWSLPVAEICHEQNAVRIVARYARLTLTLDAGLNGDDVGGATLLAGLPAELRQIEDRLLLSPSARLRARLLVAEPDAPPKRARSGPGKVIRLDEYADLDV